MRPAIAADVAGQVEGLARQEHGAGQCDGGGGAGRGAVVDAVNAVVKPRSDGFQRVEARIETRVRGLESADVSRDPGGRGGELIDVHRVVGVYASGDIAHPALVPGGADGYRICLVSDRTSTECDAAICGRGCAIADRRRVGSAGRRARARRNAPVAGRLGGCTKCG